MDTEGCKFLVEDLMTEVVIVIGDKVHYKFDNGHVELIFDTSMLPPLTLQALGLADVLTIVVELIFESPSFGAGAAPRSRVQYIKREIPTIEPLQLQSVPETTIAAPAYMVDPLDPSWVQVSVEPEGADEVEPTPPEPADGLDDSESDDDASDMPTSKRPFKQPVVATVAYQFANITRKNLAEDWPETRQYRWQQAKEWIPQLHTYLSRRLATLGDHCVICDDKQPLSGML